MAEQFFATSDSTSLATNVNKNLHTNANYPRQYVAIAFFSDSTLKTPATPSAGTITISARVKGSNIFSIPPNNVINAADQDFLRLDGPVEEIKYSTSGITDAQYMRVTVTGYKF